MKKPPSPTPLADVTGLQRDLLAVAASEEGHSGREIQTILEETTDWNITDGQLYSNLDALAERGFIDKRQRDGRTNEYTLTWRGQRALASYHSWVTDQLADLPVRNRTGRLPCALSPPQAWREDDHGDADK